MKDIRIIYVLVFVFAFQILEAQSYQTSNYFKNLKANLQSLDGFDEKVIEYCELQQQNLNLINESENVVKIGFEEYQLNDVAMDYYHGFQKLSYLDKCRLLYSWSHVSGTINNLTKSKKLPKPLSFLPVVFTGLNSFYAGENYSFGLWGLSYLPAVRYGIVADSCYDERLDLYLNSNAAINYLAELHKNFKTWDFAVTAYCCGPTNVVRAGYGQLPFDSVYNNLDSYSKDCFYRLIAFTKWMSENETLDFNTVNNFSISISDTVIVSSRIHFEQISSVLDINHKDLYELNPLYRCAVIDGRKKTKVINLPEGYKESFYLLRDSIENFMDSVYFPKYSPVIPSSNDYEPYVHVSISPGDDYEEHKYTIVSGDNLGAIAQRFGVNVSDIQDWNNISGTNIYAGQKISIWLKKGTKLPEPPKKEVQEVSKTEDQGMKKHFSMRDYDFVETYEVKSGDSLYKISLKYDWASAEDIMEWNGISDPSKLQVGQKLKIFKKKK